MERLAFYMVIPIMIDFYCLAKIFTADDGSFGKKCKPKPSLRKMWKKQVILKQSKIELPSYFIAIHQEVGQSNQCYRPLRRRVKVKIKKLLEQWMANKKI